MFQLDRIASEFLDVWPVIFAFDFGRYAVAAGVAALGLLVFGRRLAARRIRSAVPRPGQRSAEFAASVRTVFVFSLNGFGLYVGAQNGLFSIYAGIQERGWPYFAASVGLAIVAHDAYFYWTHRAMHHPALFRRFHRLHHRSASPTPWAAYAFAVPEAIVQAAFLPLFLLAVPMHGLAIFLFLTHMIVRNVLGHCGVEVMPRALATSRAWGWLTSVTHHDMHHETFGWNYGLYFTWWDRLMGTEHPAYRERLAGGAAVRETRVAATSATMVFVLAVLAGMPGEAGAAADSQPGTDIRGDWATPGYAARVRIEPCAASHEPRACGRIIWLWEPRDAAGTEKADTNNPNPALRGRALAGIEILREFRRSADGAWIEGSIYNPEDGRTYSATLHLGQTGELRVRGCALAIFCQTQVWRRAAEVCR